MKSILDYTWKEIKEMNKEKTFLFLTVAPMEEHGLHLPIGVDIELGEYWKKQAITNLEEKYNDYNFISMPFIPLASGTIKGFPGCIYIKPKKLRKLFIDILKNIYSWGIRNLIIISSHGDPFHNMSLEKACEYINKRYKTNFISPMGSFFSYKELNIDLNLGEDVEGMLDNYPNDFHAGWIETSMMLDIYPEKVTDNIFSIIDIEVSHKDMINPNRYLKKTKKLGHLGYPRFSNRKLGKDLNNSTIEYITNIVDKIINNIDYKIYKHHFLHKIPLMKFLV